MGKSFPCQSCKKWPMQVPIYQCHEGHAVCSPCSAKKNKCSTCGNNLPRKKIRCLGVEALQPIECNQDGCDKTFQNQQDMEDHVVKDCKFRKILLCESLKIKDCPFKVSPENFQEVVDHLEQAHNILQVDKPLNEIGENLFNDYPNFIVVSVQDKVAIVVSCFVKGNHELLQLHPFGTTTAVEKARIGIGVTYSDPVRTRTFRCGLSIAKPTRINYEFQMKPVLDYMQVQPWDLGKTLHGCEMYLKYFGAVGQVSSWVVNCGKKSTKPTSNAKEAPANDGKVGN